MSDLGAPGRPSFEENLNILLEELTLAGKYRRPSILLTVHKSKFGQQKAARVLEQRLAALGQKVVHIGVDKQRSDVPHLAVAMPDAAASVFFVSNLDWGSGSDHKDAYRALNIYREIFVDNHLRVVLWLTGNEAVTLARLAPDFWAFRHRVVEFVGQRIPPQIKLPVGALLWDIQNAVDPFDTIAARISVRQELLAKLPQTSEARSSRIDLLYNLGHLYWLAGDTARASQQLNAGLELATGVYADGIRASLLNGLAVLCFEVQEYARAAELLQQGLQQRPADAILLMNHAVVSNALGRNQDAVRLSEQALKLKPADARICCARGYLCTAVGKFDDATASFSKAVQLAPRMVAYHAALAICYGLVDRTDDAAHELSLARKVASGPEAALLDVYEAALGDDIPAALDLGRAALQAGQLSALDLRRDPNLSLIMDSAQLAKLIA